MTQKELLYFEDAISHEQSVISYLNCMVEDVKDEKIKSFLYIEVDHHNDLLSKLIKKLKEKANE